MLAQIPRHLLGQVLWHGQRADLLFRLGNKLWQLFATRSASRVRRQSLANRSASGDDFFDTVLLELGFDPLDEHVTRNGVELNAPLE